MQSLNDAARMAASGYPGGLAALCVRMGWPYETARKELAAAPGFKLGAERLRVMSELCIEAKGEHAHAILNAFNAGHGQFLQLPVREQSADRTLIGATVHLVQDSTQVLAAVTDARADGIISDNERKSIERHAGQVIADMQAVLAEVARENEAGKTLRSI